MLRRLIPNVRTEVFPALLFSVSCSLALITGLVSPGLLAIEPGEINLPYEKFVLDNGLTVIVHEDRKAPIVAVSVWYHVGSKDEPVGRTGFAHLFEHIMFEGSENYNDRFSKPLEVVGATSLNGTTWFDRTNYFENVPTPALDLALFLESDRMGHLLGVLTQEKLDQERGVVQNEKRQSDNQPYGMVGYRILEGLFPIGHPYRHDTIGSMEDLEAARLDDVYAWFRQYYGAANTVLVLAGDITAARGKQLAEKYFGDIEAGPPLQRLKSWVPDRSSNTLEQMYDRVPQVRSFQNWAVPGRTTRERALLELAAYVLGQGKNSRLYQALIHETQHAVSLDVSIEPHELTSIFSIDTTLQSEASLEEVNEIIAYELAEFLRKGPREDELQRARSSINASFVRGLEAIGGFDGKAPTLAQGELYDGNPAFFKTFLQWINDASAEEVRSTAEQWLADGRYQLDVMPYPEYTANARGIDRSKGLPVVTDLPSLVFPAVERAQLNNGIEVVLTERKSLPVVEVAIQFDAGYAADQGRTLGTASFTLDMLDESTRNRTALEVDAETERLGAELASGSNLDTSAVYLSALKSGLADSINLFADVVQNPAFAPEEIERMRVRKLARIEQEKSQPAGVALRSLPPLIYGRDHPYGIPFTGSGTEESVNLISTADLEKFHTDWLRPDNAQIFVVGDTTMKQVLPMLENAFGNWKSKGKKPSARKTAEILPGNKSRVFLIDKPGSPQSLILAGHIAPSSGALNHIAIDAMNDIIGGTYSARINQTLRVQKQWSYGAYSLMPDAREQRPWMIYAPVQTDQTAAAVEELDALLNGFRLQQPATVEELSRVVRNSVFSLPGQYETNNAVLDALLSNSRFGRADDFVTSIAGKYNDLSQEQIQAAAEEVLHPEALIWVIVGDGSLIRESLEKLNLAPVQSMDEDGNILQ